MSIKISLSKKSINKSSSNLILFVNDNFKINNLKKALNSSEFSYIDDLLKSSDLKKNFLVFELSSKKKVVLISIKNNFKISDIENLGAEFFGTVNYGKNCEYFLNTDTINSKFGNFISHFLHGLKLKSYEFKKYKTKKENRVISIYLYGNKNKPSVKNQIKFKALEEGTFYARDLVSEPGNILHPDEYAKRLISLKPAKFMEDMTYDMAGSAAVVGLMKSLALRKAKINAVGVVGLVENMVSGVAQRPGDIVKSYSGKTIEVLNTDAEGRLVLADAITYTEKKFKPKFIIDLATLTGAIIVCLGSEYAGLFSNDDNLSKQILKAGEQVEEKLWRMPLHKNYDKLMNSKNADVQNINYVGGAGSTTAAQFLQRFIINKTPWAHLDIAGMAFSKYGGALNSGGATGFGVRLLNQLIEENYEK